MFRSTNRLIAFALCGLIVWTVFASAAPARAQSAYTNDNVRKLVVLGKIRGHLAASIWDWDNAQYDLAMHHSVEVGQELFSIIGSDLKTANLDADFKAMSDAYTQLSMQAGDKDKVHAAYDKLADVLTKAATAFSPQATFDDPAFRVSVAQGLLAGVEEEYAEGVKDGKVSAPVGYQNAVGFWQIAKEHYAAAQKIIQAKYPDLDKTLTGQIAALDQVLPGYPSPDKPADEKDLETAINAIKAAVSKALGIDLEVHRSVPEVIAATRTGLLDALDAYQNGKTDDAYEAASAAYLDNFEGLESPLRKKDSALTDLLEKQIVDFGKAIKNKQPLADLKVAYAQIDANLSKAQDLLRAS